MTEESLQTDMQNKDLKCPVCLDFYTDPVQLACGHNFCQTCIRAVWDCDILETGPFFCPECQIFWDVRDSLEINMRLQKEVQEFGTRNPAVRDLSPAAPIIPCDHCIDANSMAVKTCLTCDASLCAAHLELHLKKAVFRGHTIIKVTGNPFSLKCAEHREELKLYCQEDGISVCSLCVVIGSHKNHRVVTSQEACTEMKKIMEENINKLLEMCQLAEETMRGMDSLFSEVSQRATSIKKRICGKYRRLKMLIEEDEDLIMRILEAEERYSLKWLLSKKEALECQINEMDAIVNTSKSLIQEEDGLVFLQHVKTHGLGKTPVLPLCCTEKDQVEMAKFKTTEKLVDKLFMAVSCHLPRMWSNFRDVTFNPDTAHTKLEVSHDKLEVCWSKLPFPQGENSERFDSQYSVLAENKLSDGQHYWEVIVQEKPYWLIGVAYGSIPRKGGKGFNSTNLGMNKVSWCIYHSNGQYLACHDSQETPVPFQERVEKLGIWVDFSNQVLSFYNADTLSLLHSFSVQYLEAVYPVFNPCIDINNKNCQPLILFHLKDRS